MSVHVPPRLAMPAPVIGERAYQKAGPMGPGAGVLQTEFNLGFLLSTDPQRKARMAWNIGQTVSYVFAAERVISGRIGGLAPLARQGDNPVGWHLEDPEGETIDDDYEGDGAELAIRAFHLLADPMAEVPLADCGIRYSRRQQWELTSRHMGLCGYTFWVLDQIDEYGIPSAILYVRPDRMSPKVGANGILQEWTLDKGLKPGNEGTPLSIGEVVPFYLQAPNEGYLSTGLVEAAVVKAQLNGAIDKHFAQTIAGGGRLSGIIAPRQGVIDDDNVYQQMVRDWRNVVEQPESAKRVQIVRAPVDFTRTVASPEEMGIIDLMGANRDDLLALWGVPYSQVGGSPAAGMGMGEARDSDKQALWENAIAPRLAEMVEPIQNLMDRFRALLGWAPLFVLDEPTFENAGARYDKLQKAAGIPMRNRERRALIGLDPFGELVLGTTGAPLDDEIVLPIQYTTVGAAPEGGYDPNLEAEVATPPAGGQLPPDQPPPGTKPAVPDPVPSGPVPVAAHTRTPPALPGVAQKARAIDPATKALRAQLTERLTPVVQARIQTVLRDQRKDISDRVVAKWDDILEHPRDTKLWWPTTGPGGTKEPWDAAMVAAVKPALSGAAELIGEHLASSLGAGKAKADEPAKHVRHVGQLGAASKDAVEHALTRGGTRITRVNEYTRDGIRKLIAEAIEKGMSPREAGDLVQAWSGFDEYRAERIARTELMFSYNAAALTSYDGMGVELVQAIDGDEDDECRDRLALDSGYGPGIYTLADAMGIDDHPNGTLDWAPVL